LKGKTGILVVVDRLTKMAHFEPVKKEIDAMETVDVLLKTVFKHHRLPDKIILDRGPQFISKVLKEIYKKMDIQAALSTAYHPQTDGQTEWVNQDLETYIRLFCNKRQNDWSKWLHLAEFVYNNRVHLTIKTTPFFANNLTNPQWTLETRVEDLSHPKAQDLLMEIKEVKDKLKACLEIAAETMKTNMATRTP
jgi:hypothetical protein